MAEPTRHVWVEHRPNGRETAVYWAAPTVLPAGFLGFHVYRSPEPTDNLSSPSLQRLTTDPVGVPFFLDPQPTSEPFGIPSYLVTAVGSSRENPIDGPVQVGDTSDADRQGRRFPILSMPRIFAEFRRRKDILLGLTGETVTVLVRRLIGRRCRECFQGAYEGSGRAACSVCFGVGWERGYEAVDGVPCRVGSISETLRLQPEGVELNANPKGWLVGFPLLRTGDVIVRRDAKRYEVQRVSLTVHQGVLTGQDFDLIAYEPGHPIYSFPLE